MSNVPSGCAVKRNAPVALTVTVLVGSLRLVTVTRRPGDVAIPEKFGLLGRSIAPPLPSKATMMGNGQASPAANVSAWSTGLGGAPVAAPGVNSAAVSI